MATVIFRTIDAGRTGVVQFHFAAPRNRTHFDQEIKLIHDSIAQTVPERNRHYDQSTLSWQVPRSHWPKIQKLLLSMGFSLRQETYKVNGFREATQEIAKILCFSCLPLGAALIQNVFAHLFHSRSFTTPIRPFIAIVLCLVCLTSFRFAEYLQGFASACLAVVFRPIDPIWFKSWLVWQVLNWGTLLLIAVFTIRCALAAGKERKLDHWWQALSAFEPYVDVD